MATQVKLYEAGSPNVLKLEQVPRENPGPNHAWIEQDAIG